MTSLTKELKQSDNRVNLLMTTIETLLAQIATQSREQQYHNNKAKIWQEHISQRLNQLLLRINAGICDSTVAVVGFRCPG